MNERRNGTRRLYRARPEGLVELKAFLDEFWNDRLEALKRDAEREKRRTMEQTTERLARTRDRDRGETGDRLGVPHRPREGTAWWGRLCDSTLGPGGTSGRRHAAALARGEFARSRAAAPARLHVGLGKGGAGRSSSHPGRRTVEIDLVAERGGDDAAASSTAACRTRGGVEPRRRAGITTSAGWPSRPPVATRALTPGRRRTA